jgi:nucleotide-binding universal stress UspA family protein
MPEPLARSSYDKVNIRNSRERTMDKRILVATDGTKHSKIAVSHAIDLAAATQAELLVAVVNVATGGVRGSFIYSYTDEDAAKIVRAAAEEARQAGVKKVSEAVIASREADSGIVQYADEKKVDHIVVGTGDKHGISRLVLGSVAADIARRAQCTVTVAR